MFNRNRDTAPSASDAVIIVLIVRGLALDGHQDASPKSANNVRVPDHEHSVRMDREG